MLLIRHAISTFNYLTFDISKNFGPATSKAKLEIDVERRNPVNIDPPLYVIGRYQCEFIDTIDFEVVFASPMLRTLETALFANHPNRDKIKFIALPLASSSDVAGDTAVTRERFPDLDFKIVGDYWIHALLPDSVKNDKCHLSSSFKHALKTEVASENVNK